MAITLDLDFTASDVLDPRITFSRASLGTYYDSAGVLKYAGHNLVVQSQDFNTTWAKVNSATITVDATTAPDGTLTADRINHTVAGTAAGGGVNSATFGVSPTTQILSIYAKAGTKNWLSFGTNINAGISNAWFNLATGTLGTKGANVTSYGMTSVGNGWYRCWIVWGAASVSMYARVAEADNSFNCTSTGDIFAWGAQCEFVTTETTPRTYMPTTTAAVHGPRFDYDPVTHAAKGLLIEEARTNLMAPSENFTGGAYGRTGCNAALAAATAPNGLVTANSLTATASPAWVWSPSVVATGTSYASSVFLKKGTSDWAYVAGEITGTGAEMPRAYFNLATGTVGTIDANITSATIQDCGGGWYRCTITRLGTAGSENWSVGICDANGNPAVTVGKTIYIWGAQYEIGATFASSYIATTAGAVTRAADVAVMTGSNFSSWYNQPAGTFVAEFDCALSGNRYVLSADNGSANQQIAFYRSSGAFARTDVTAAGAVFATNIGTVVAGTNKLGLSATLNDFAGCLNGGAVVLDTLGAMPTPTQLRIGIDQVNANSLNGHIRRIQYQNIAVSDAQLVILTTPGAWPVEGSVGAMTATGTAAAVGQAQIARTATMTGTGTANATGSAVIFASGAMTGSGLGQALGVSAAIARSVGWMEGRGVSMSGSAFDAGEVPKGPGGTSKAMARKLKAADERRKQFEKEREARLKGLVLPRPLFKPAPETVAMLHAIHDEDEEEELLLLLLGS